MKPPNPLTHRSVSLSIVALLVWLSPAVPATAQTTGIIEGTVVGANGFPMSGALVTLTGTAASRESVATADGSFRFADLAAGDYVVTARLPGFETAELQVALEAGATRTAQLVLQVTYLFDTLSVVAEEPRIFARNFVPESMIRQQSTITSVAAVVDNLPGVSVQEGDAYGFDDWSSNVAVRGFQVTISEAQIGTTIDGFPNGTSDYFSGAKANRFVDPMNLASVEVSQGTADIASRSVEALGGTFNYLTSDPAAERTYTASATIGENGGERFFMRVDTGPLFGGATRAWIAGVRQEATDWVQGSARNEREHLAAKLVSAHGSLDLTSYISYDAIHEDTYQRLYSDSDFRANPRWDRLVGDWPGVPYLNQFYRPGWQTRRNNTLAYLRANWAQSELSSLSAGIYYHRNRGRGDWLPPYIVDLVDDRGGPESELAGYAPIRGGAQLGLIRFVDGNGVAVEPTPGCTSSYIFNYYGSGGAAVDPACHPGATAVQSYRHSHYGKDRFGLTLDEEWSATLGRAGSALRAGIWYEGSTRHLGRDWHRMLDPTLSFKWDEQANPI
ncbi:MAG: TonB-dependent receptor [Gammaproteobacteria bacterium]|nr:TonB-dependent receptor [Gammaproteobacteria bacterium]